MKHSFPWIPTIIMGIIALGLTLMAYLRGEGEHLSGLKVASNLIMAVAPLLIFALIVAGMIQVLVPSAFVAKWVGGDSGFKGILLGSVAGSLTPGGPFVCLPLAAGFTKAGASSGAIVAYLTAWALVGVSRIPLEVGILGWKLTAVRFASTLILAPIAGLIAQLFFSSVNLKN